MRTFITFILLIGLFTANVSAQIFNPVKWKTDYKQISPTEFDLIYTAIIDDGWTVYSQYLENDDGPVATNFNYDEGAHFALKGKNIEAKENRKEGHDAIFDMTLAKFSKKAVFTQRITVTDFSKPVTGYVNYMTCDATKCLPPSDVDFSFSIKPTTGGSGDATKATKETKVVEAAKTEVKKKVEAPKVVTKVQETATQVKEKIAETTNKVKQSVPKVVAPIKKTVEKVEQKTADVDLPIDIKKPNPKFLDPVKWDVKINNVEADVYYVDFIAKMDKGWAVYSQDIEEGGPEPSSFNFDEAANFVKQGKTIEKGKAKKAADPLFGGIVVTKYLNSPVTFRQKIKVSETNKSITGYFSYMTCDDKQCLPPKEVDFVVYPDKQSAVFGSEASAIVDQMNNGGTPTPTINAGSATAAAMGAAFLPKELANVDLKNPVGKCATAATVIETNTSLWRIFVLGFLGGLVALLTPCVFPMIPLTVSFFTKGGGADGTESKGIGKAVLYGFFILLVYLILSIPFHLMDSINPNILNDISTNVYLNVAFFLIFLFFAFSFFGFYELTLPASWTNRASSAEGVGGVLGIFFMALTLALVSFSCTGPILGSLLAGALSSDGGAMQLTSGMAGFGVALGLPFALFAAFPSVMDSLPKSGGWLNTVKVTLGFIELALAFKFLSNADLVTRWGLLKIEPFLIIWILCFLGLGLYLFGKIKFPHDSPIKKLGIPRMALGALSLAFAVYLMSGFRYNDKSESFTSLSLLSGLAPPAGYSWMYPKDCPNNLDCFKDFEKGLSYAKEVNKPILVDFTGHACVNCRKMEEHVWPQQGVANYLEEDYVLISLYVDDKIDLPEEERETVTWFDGTTKKLRRSGQKWQYMQFKYFENNSQPWYALLSPDGKLLNSPVGYTPDKEEYANFLQCGLDAFKNKKIGSNE